MNQTIEQFSSNAQDNLVALEDLTVKAHASIESLMELNLATTKDLMAEMFEYAKAMAAARDPQSLVVIQSGLAKPVGEIVNAYAQEFQKIVASNSSEFSKAAQASMVSVQRGMSFMMESATKGAPFGSGFGLDPLNQVMAASQKMFDTSQTSTEQVIHLVKKTAKAA